MGMQTNISILNDDFEWIRKNPKKFVQAIASGMNSGSAPVRRGGRWGEADKWRTDEEREAVAYGVTIHQAHHMDTPAIYFEHQNSSYDVWDLILAVKKGLLDDVENREVWENILKGVVTNLRVATNNLEKELKGATGERPA